MPSCNPLPYVVSPLDFTTGSSNGTNIVPTLMLRWKKLVDAIKSLGACRTIVNIGLHGLCRCNEVCCETNHINKIN